MMIKISRYDLLYLSMHFKVLRFLLFLPLTKILQTFLSCQLTNSPLQTRLSVMIYIFFAIRCMQNQLNLLNPIVDFSDMYNRHIWSYPLHCHFQLNRRVLEPHYTQIRMENWPCQYVYTRCEEFWNTVRVLLMHFLRKKKVN